MRHILLRDLLLLQRFYVGRVDMRKFCHIQNLPAVDINQRRPLAKHFKIAVSPRHHRDLAQHVVCRTGMGKYTVFYTCYKARSL